MVPILQSLNMCYDAFENSAPDFRTPKVYTRKDQRRYPEYLVPSNQRCVGIRYPRYVNGSSPEGYLHTTLESEVYVVRQTPAGIESLYIRKEKPLSFFERLLRRQRNLPGKFHMLPPEAPELMMECQIHPAAPNEETMVADARVLISLLLHNLQPSVPSTAIDL